MAKIAAKPSKQDQDIAIRNYDSAFDALTDINGDGTASADEILFHAFAKVDEIITALDVLAGRAHFFFIILPCDGSTLVTFGNCGAVNQFQVESSLFDVNDFLVAVEYEGLIDPDDVGAEYLTLFESEGIESIAKGTVEDIFLNGNFTRVDYRIQTISDVTPSAVPLPPSIGLFLLAMTGLFFFRAAPRVFGAR